MVLLYTILFASFESTLQYAKPYNSTHTGTLPRGSPEAAVIGAVMGIFTFFTRETGGPTTASHPDAAAELQPHNLHGKRLREVGGYLPQMISIIFIIIIIIIIVIM